MIVKKLFRWGKRAFVHEHIENAKAESPSALIRQAFFRKKGAVVALALLVALFLFVFIAPVFVGIDINDSDALSQNLAPGYGLSRVPRGLKNQIQKIDGFAGFTAGVNTKGEVFVWGDTKEKLGATDLKKIPKQVIDEGAMEIGVGKDHILAITKTGTIVGWGDKSCGQYGYESVLGALPMPDFLQSGVDATQVSGLSCGYQASALVFKDGSVCVWGNENTVYNLRAFVSAQDVKKIVFTNTAVVGITSFGTLLGTERFYSANGSFAGKIESVNEYLQDKKAVDIAATNKCIALILESGELVVSGAAEYGERELPKLLDGERFVSIDGGTRHFVGVTNLGNAYAWGYNAYKQCEVSKVSGATQAFAGAQQSYVAENGKLVLRTGLKGYLMGTDGRGRDVFARIVHGGKMTMTIGAVAVIVSSVIAVLVGVTAGFFGGMVDTLLMRITEIFSSIPFLPFAMLLSQIIKNYNLTETTRIFIIMLILGALSWTGLARMIRGQVLAEREKEFVSGARALGVKESKIAFKHVLPNIASVILVSMTLDFAGCLLTESSLSYLGFGVQQPRPTWGNMLTGANSSIVIQNYWWQWLFPALFLSLATICINVVGDALRDAIEPK